MLTKTPEHLLGMKRGKQSRKKKTEESLTREALKCQGCTLKLPFVNNKDNQRKHKFKEEESH